MTKNNNSENLSQEEKELLDNANTGFISPKPTPNWFAEDADYFVLVQQLEFYKK